MKLQRRDGYVMLVGGPVPPQADAITLGRLIVVRRRAADNEALLSHELVHVRQFGQLGPVRFVARYLGSYLRARLGGWGHMAAYRRIPLEVEASWLSRLHDLAELEPGSGGAGARDPQLSDVRSPKPPVAQRLQHEAARRRGRRGRPGRSSRNESAVGRRAAAAQRASS